MRYTLENLAYECARVGKQIEAASTKVPFERDRDMQVVIQNLETLAKKARRALEECDNA